jgi:SAM-dependent methyltransferase
MDHGCQDWLEEQRKLYEGAFYRSGRWRWVFRDDCRYRWHRLGEVLSMLGVATAGLDVYELGFGTGDLLFRFPTSCALMGAELSAGAVEAIRTDPRIKRYRPGWFEVTPPDGSVPVPPWSADIAIASHVIEHVPDDRGTVTQLAGVLKPGGLMVLFVPLEPPGFDPKHLRTYTVQSVADLVREAGLEVLHAEENYHIRSGPFSWMDHPSRHGWPVLGFLEGIRNVAMTLIPYPLARASEELLAGAGIAGTQCLVVARRSAGQSRRGVR